MHITVRLDEATLTQLLAELLPITVVLDATGGSLGDRWVTIDPVRHLELRSGDGIRLLTSGALRWTVGFVPVTVTIARLVLMLRPLVGVLAPPAVSYSGPSSRRRTCATCPPCSIGRSSGW